MSSETLRSDLLSFPRLLEHHASTRPHALAVLAPGRNPLTYGRLHDHLHDVSRSLRALGIGRQDRVVLMLPNGPEMAVSVAAVSASAVCVPMNPAYGARELQRYFAELCPRALIVAAGADVPARTVAVRQGIGVIELSRSDDDEAGLFTLAAGSTQASLDEPARPDDVMLNLLTSGTTSWAKIVPQTHANVCSSARSNARSLGLTEDDRCLNILPLFHGHGLVATVLTSLAAGASVVCTPGCEVGKFFSWMDEFAPTWYSAVPTMHQAIVGQARRQVGSLPRRTLRFVRSASAPLPLSLLAGLEQTFRTPVIEFYGMTETASSPIACNPLPPKERKPGSVGRPVDLRVAVMDQSLSALPPGQVGEIVVAGPSVTKGYDGDPAAVEAAFVDAGFKTGDTGYFDEDGYLFLTGRSKEIINRGGEKITPWEVDDALLEHSAVAEAIGFAVPHSTLGEEVGAAVVLRAGAAATPRELRQFARQRLTEFKVPSHVVVVDRLPRGPTGKVRRVDLAVQLGLTDPSLRRPTFVPPRSQLERILADSWADILGVEHIGIDDDFFALGGDSLMLAELGASLCTKTNVSLDFSHFFEAPTLRETAHHLQGLNPPRHTRLPIPRASRLGPIPASAAQKQLWRLQERLGQCPFLNVFCPLRIVADTVDSEQLERSINAMVARHEILRTAFVAAGADCMQLIAPTVAVKLVVDDLTALSAAEREYRGLQAVEEETLHSFDLTRVPLFRVRLLRFAEQDQLLLVTVHGIVMDWWSLGVFIEDISLTYQADADPGLPLDLQYADFAAWQTSWPSQPDLLQQLDYWRGQLRDPTPGSVAPAVSPTGRTERHELMLPDGTWDAVRMFALREGCTPFMCLVAAFKTLLQRYEGQDDIRAATLVANRIRWGTPRMIGNLANLLVLRTNLNGDPSLLEVLHRVRSTVLEGFDHQEFPFETLAGVLEQETGVKAIELARYLIAFHQTSSRPIGRHGHNLLFEEANPNITGPLMAPGRFDLSLMLRESIQGVRLSCVYKTNLFTAEAIAGMMVDFIDLLELMTTQAERRVSTIALSAQGDRFRDRSARYR